MKIIIKYNGENVLATVLEDHKVEIPCSDSVSFTIELDQCKECGAWKSEDEELYGDGYCSRCCTMCDYCQQYKPLKEMMDFKTIDCNQCISCNDKDSPDK